MRHQTVQVTTLAAGFPRFSQDARSSPKREKPDQTSKISSECDTLRSVPEGQGPMRVTVQVSWCPGVRVAACRAESTSLGAGRLQLGRARGDLARLLFVCIQPLPRESSFYFLICFANNPELKTIYIYF